MNANRYKSGSALRTGLEERLKRVAREEAVDLQRLRRQVAFDRLLARLFAEPRTDWVLKGGYAMELRLRKSRSTKDLDFTVRSTPSGTGDVLRTHLQERSEIETADYFSFRVGEAMMDLDAAPSGGARYPVEALLGGRTFVKFHVDVGVGDIVFEPLETTTPRDWLGFAGVTPPLVSMIPPEQHFAEKVHAYTLPRGSVPNSRVRDLVDMVLLIRSGQLKPGRVEEELIRTFERRGTHDLSKTFPPPPSEWDGPFRSLAAECDLELAATEAYSELQAFADRLMPGDLQ